MTSINNQEKNTEEIIFEAAQQVFIQKGFDGARMQEIAEKAGINKALLHYYYRTKEKLFHTILEKVLTTLLPKVLDFIESDISFEEKIRFFVKTYMEILFKNPYIPNFILNELNRNPEGAAELLKKSLGLDKINVFGRFSAVIQKEIDEGHIRPIQPEQLMVNMISLCVFPIVARPIIQGVIFENDKKRYNDFLESRKTEVSNFIIQSIKPIQ
jgi:AcrR family transcriptional regulator